MNLILGTVGNASKVSEADREQQTETVKQHYSIPFKSHALIKFSQELHEPSYLAYLDVRMIGNF